MVSEPIRYAYDVADAVNCSVQRSSSTRREDLASRRRQSSSPAAATTTTTRHERLVECLKRVPAELLGVVVGASSLRPPRYRSAFGPVLDRRSAVPRPPSRLMAGAVSVAPVFEASAVLVGVTTDDSPDPGGGGGDGGGSSTAEDAAFRRRLLRTYVQNVYTFHRQKIYDVLAYHYTDWEHPTYQQGTQQCTIHTRTANLTRLLYSRLHASCNAYTPTIRFVGPIPFSVTRCRCRCRRRCRRCGHRTPPAL